MSEPDSTHLTPSERRGYNNIISHGELLKILSYEPETGIFTWLTCVSRPDRVGRQAGYVRPKDGIVIRINGVRYRAARLAWYYMTGSWPYEFIDHVDGNPLNNRWSNLRSVDASINAQNRREALRRKIASAPLGVYMHKSGRYQASMTVTILGKKRSIYLGLYGTEQEAQDVYIEFKRMIHDGATI